MTGGGAHVERLADRLAAAGPLLGTAAPETVAATLGWRTVGAFGGNEILVDAGVPGGENVALLFTTADGRRLFTGARVTLAQAPGRAPVTDAFADAAATLSPRFGRFPTGRPGFRPSVTWRLGRVGGSRLPWRRRHAVITLESPGDRVDLAVRTEEEATALATAATAAAVRAEAELARAEPARAEPAEALGTPAPADGFWDRFAAALTTELAGLEPGHVMIIADRAVGDSFVQFMQFGVDDPPYLTAETISDHFREDHRPLTDDQRHRLAALGWEAPGEANWSHHLEWPARWDAYARLAAMAVGALRDVHGIRSPADLVLGGWGYDDSRPAPYPRLGLAVSG